MTLQATVKDRGNVVTGTNFAITVDPNPFPWHNWELPADINDDGSVTALDALLIINYINSDGASNIPPDSNPAFGWLDSSKDNTVTALDALLVINEINNPGGEGEQALTELPNETPRAKCSALTELVGTTQTAQITQLNNFLYMTLTSSLHVMHIN